MSKEGQKQYFISEQRMCPVCKGSRTVYSEKWGMVFEGVERARNLLLEPAPYLAGIISTTKKAAEMASAATNDPIRVGCGNCSSKGTVLVPVRLTEEMIGDMVADLDSPAEPAPKGRRASNAI